MNGLINRWGCCDVCMDLISVNLLCFFSDEDEDGELRRSVPLSPLERFFSEDDSVKQHKKKKPSKIMEGKEPKVKKKKKKEVTF